MQLRPLLLLRSDAPRKPARVLKRRRSIRRVLPLATIAKYERILREIAKVVHAIVESEALAKVASIPGLARGDAASVLHVDDGSSVVLKGMLAKWRAYVKREGGRLRGELREIDREIQAHTKEQLRLTIKASLGIDPRVKDPDLSHASDAFIKSNVGLITSIGARHFERVEKTVREASNAGTRVEVLAARLEKMIKPYDANGKPINAEARSMLIARDQILKHNANLDRQRQTAVGIDEYVWRTAGDERVREEHAELDGETFAYSASTPIGLHPGEDYQCRCYAEPVIKLSMFETAGE